VGWKILKICAHFGLEVAISLVVVRSTGGREGLPEVAAVSSIGSSMLVVVIARFLLSVLSRAAMVRPVSIWKRPTVNGIGLASISDFDCDEVVSQSVA
jgi:hypothetical protein